MTNYNPMKSKSFDLMHNPLTNSTFNGFKSSIENNILLNTIYQSYFITLAMSLFEWKNLPETMDSNFIEYGLCTQGAISVINDNTKGIFNTLFTTKGNLNMYNLPTSIEAYSENGEFLTKKEFKEEDFVIIPNNICFIPTIIYINYFANKIIATQNVIDINLNAQKTPVFLQGTQNQKLSLVNLYEKYDGNVPYIFGERGLGDLISVLKTDAPFVADKLLDVKRNYTNEFLTFLGVNNIGEDKKERLLTDEVNANNQFISINFDVFYHQRKLACEAINKKFNLDISVEPRVNSNILNNDNFNFNIEGGNNE